MVWLLLEPRAEQRVVGFKCVTLDVMGEVWAPLGAFLLPLWFVASCLLGVKEAR